jgi:hypothetical protein
MLTLNGNSSIQQKLIINWILLSLSAWNKVLNEEKTDDNLANLYFKYHHRNSIAFEEQLENENKLYITTKRDVFKSAKFVDPFA